ASRELRAAVTRTARSSLRGQLVAGRDAEDLTQQALVRVLERDMTHELPADARGLQSYLRRAVRNGAVDAYRSEKRLRERVTEESGVFSAPGLFCPSCPEETLIVKRNIERMRVTL